MGLYSMSSDFDLKKHKETYHQYLEAMILPDGTVKYAVPSHVIFAEHAAMQKLGVSYKKLCAMIPVEGGWLEELLSISGIVAVWYDGYLMGKQGATKKQIAALKRLKLNGVYKGAIPQRAEQEAENREITAVKKKTKKGAKA